jgi:hypothetical protein
MKISFDGKSIQLSIESPIPSARSHTLRIPIERCGVHTNKSGGILPDQVGWHQLLSILKAQHLSQFTHQRTIGNPSAPVQYDLSQIEKIKRGKKKKKKIALPEITLEELFAERDQLFAERDQLYTDYHRIAAGHDQMHNERDEARAERDKARAEVRARAEKRGASHE